MSIKSPYLLLLREEPIKYVVDDWYGRDEYVRNFALGLSQLQGPDLLVVGVQGP